MTQKYEVVYKVHQDGDEENARSRTATAYALVDANSVSEAEANLAEFYKDTRGITYSIQSIKKSKITDVITLKSIGKEPDEDEDY